VGARRECGGGFICGIVFLKLFPHFYGLFGLALAWLWLGNGVTLGRNCCREGRGKEIWYLCRREERRWKLAKAKSVAGRDWA
jgi:hypothetical protein